MKYAQPLTQELSVVDNGITYKKTIYLSPTTLTGVTDETYPLYDSATTYNTGDYVIVDTLKTIYRCTADNTAGVFPPSDPSVWVDYGFINSYKMFSTDEQIGSQTEGTDITLEISFNRCDTVGLINTQFADLLLEQIDNDTGTITDESVGTGDGTTTVFNLANNNIVTGSEKIYIDDSLKTKDTDYTINYDTGEITFTTAPANGSTITADYTKAVVIRKISGRDIGCTSFAEYFYDEIKEKSRVIITDLEWLPNSTLKLTFSGGASSVKIGSLVIGLLQPLGITLMGTELRFEDRSKILNDEFTDTRKVIRYGHVRVLRGNIMFDVPDFNVVAQKISEIIGKNVLFVPDETDKFSEMTNIAYIEEFNMPVENPVVFQTDMTLIGVA